MRVMLMMVLLFTLVAVAAMGNGCAVLALASSAPDRTGVFTSMNWDKDRLLSLKDAKISPVATGTRMDGQSYALWEPADYQQMVHKLPADRCELFIYAGGNSDVVRADFALLEYKEVPTPDLSKWYEVAANKYPKELWGEKLVFDTHVGGMFSPTIKPYDDVDVRSFLATREGVQVEIFKVKLLGAVPGSYKLITDAGYYFIEITP